MMKSESRGENRGNQLPERQVVVVVVLHGTVRRTRRLWKVRTQQRHRQKLATTSTVRLATRSLPSQQAELTREPMRQGLG